MPIGLLGSQEPGCLGKFAHAFVAKQPTDEKEPHRAVNRVYRGCEPVQVYARPGQQMRLA